VSTEEVPKQSEEIEIDEYDPQDDKYDANEWETIEKVMADGSVKKYRRRKFETVITTVNKRYNETMVDGGPMRMEEFEIDDAHPENMNLDPSECEILEKTLPDGTQKRYSRRIVASALPASGKENEVPELWEEVEIDESNPEDEKYDADEWEVLERTLPNGTTKRFRRRNLNVVTVHKKPIAITAGDVPLRVQDIEIEEDLEPNTINFDDWEVVEKTLPDGRKKKFYRKILTTIFSSLDDKK
jgi:NADH:ubiquinone oxidoreductase subunit